MEIPPFKQDLGWFFHFSSWWKGIFLSSLPFSITKDCKFSQVGINNPCIEVFCLWVYFENIFPSGFVVIFVCLELGQFARSQEGKTKRKLLFLSLEMMPQITLIFIPRQWKNEYLAPNAVTCLFHLCYSDFWVLGTVNFGAQAPLHHLLLHWGASMAFTEPLQNPLARRVRCKARNSNKQNNFWHSPEDITKLLEIKYWFFGFLFSTVSFFSSRPLLLLWLSL